MANYRKALKNYTSTASISGILQNIQDMLVDARASSIAWMYDDKGMVSGVIFGINYRGSTLAVRVPFSTEKIRAVLKKQGIIKNRDSWRKGYKEAMEKDEERVYRVGLANVRDWLDSQLTFLLLEQVELPQLFLPYIQNPQTGKTIYESVLESNMLSLPQSEF